MIRKLFAKPGVPWLLLAVSLVVILALVFIRGSAPAPQTTKPAAAAQPAAPQAAAPALAAVPEGEWEAVTVSLKHTPSQDFGDASVDGDLVSAEWARLFVWDVDLRRQLNPGDVMRAGWHWTDEAELEIGVATLKVNKLGKTFRAYRFLAPGDKYPSYWNEQGAEVARRLNDSPIEDYEQVTSLLKDRPTHKGMDFKTDVGTEVNCPKAGVVLRSNWNWSANGNCIEVQFEDGTIAKFLHLSENRVKVGDKLTAGQIIALSGNTGHSTGAHLHYQLNTADGRVIDPIDYHGTTQRQLDAGSLASVQATVQKFDALLDNPPKPAAPAVEPVAAIVVPVAKR
jgi:murein DD-endopeptidase MepM/ murein hydrolase activator NlpD